MKPDPTLLVPARGISELRQVEQGGDCGWREVCPGPGGSAGGVQVAVEETLPTAEGIGGLGDAEGAGVDGAGELVEVQQPVMAAVQGDHDVDVEIAEGVPVPF